MTLAHDFLVDSRKKFLNSLFWAVGNLILAAAIFASFFSRFSGQGIILLRLVFATLVVTCVLSIRDLCSSKTRLRGGAALLLCAPILVFFGLLTVWEGPLYVSVTGRGGPVRFNVAGPAGFYGLSIYGSEHRKAEWRDDEIGLLWRFSWSKHSFPSMRTQFAYGTLPVGYLQKTPWVPPALDPDSTYTLVVNPGMGLPEYFTLRGNSLVKSNNEYGDDVCWGQLNVPGQNAAASVRVDCKSGQFLPMSPRAQERLRAYREKRLFMY